MAGEIYIADKETLDDVKDTVDSINLKSEGSKFLTVNEILQNRLVVGTFSGGSTNRNPINISTPGVLYFVIGFYTGASTSVDPGMSVTVDGNIIYYRTLPAGNTVKAGVLYSPSGIIADDTKIVPSGTTQLSAKTYPPNDTLVNMKGNLVLPKPLKFNTLSISISGQSSYVIDYMYTIDL